MQVKDKIVIITWASSWIWLALVDILAEEWAILVLVGRSDRMLKKLNKTIVRSFVIISDLSKENGQGNIIEQTMNKFGRIDILINCAWQWICWSIEDINISELKYSMEVNFFAVVNLMKRVFPIMKKQWCWLILNVWSALSRDFFKKLSAYSSTKHALRAISLIADKEFSEYWVSVCIFHPNKTSTDFFKNSLGTLPKNQKVWNDLSNPKFVAKNIYSQILSEEKEIFLF